MSLRQKYGLGFVLLWFIGGGIFHFIPAGHHFFSSIVPPWLPAPSTLVYISGALELVSAAGLLFECSRRLAGYALILITLGVSPANVHMWMHPELYTYAPEWIYGLRLVFQLVLLWLIWWSTRPTATPATGR